MIRKFFIASILSILSLNTAIAGELRQCDWVASVHNIWEPWEDYTRTFASGNIRIVAMDTGGEPTCCAEHLVILSPHPEWGRSCTVLSSNESLGFNRMYFDEITASYDPAKGLLLSVPVSYYDYEASGVERFEPETFNIRINQATGTVELE